MLTGLRVADFSTHFSGPLASHLLTELGADVIKVEHHRVGDGNREIPPSVEGESVFHNMLSAGARSLAVDARSEEWPQIVAAAVGWADVVLVAGSESVLARRGLSFAQVGELDPRIVYCIVPGFGSVGPWADWNAHGQGPDAMAGNVELIDGDDGRFTTRESWRGMGTTLAGTFAALGILAAVLRRDEVNAPQRVEASLWASSFWSSWRDIACELNAGVAFIGTRDRGSRYGIYKTKDGRGIQVAPIEEKFWKQFCDLLDLPAEVRERGGWNGRSMDFGDGPDYEGEVELIAERLATKDLAEWSTILGDAGVPVAPILNFGEVVASEHARAEEVLRTVPPAAPGLPSFQMPRSPIRLTDADGSDPLPVLGHAPKLGEHNAEVRALWGLDASPSAHSANESV